MPDLKSTIRTGANRTDPLRSGGEALWTSRSQRTPSFTDSVYDGAMKPIVIALLLACVSSASADPPKVATFDEKRALTECNEGKAPYQEWVKNTTGLQKVTDEGIAHDEEFERKLTADKDKMSPADYQKNLDALRANRAHRDELYANGMKAHNAKLEKAQKPIRAKIPKVMNAIVQRDHLTLVLPADGVLYISPGGDITDDAIKMLNETK
jgi:Skp family chaperone for outer membrane proteins